MSMLSDENPQGALNSDEQESLQIGEEMAQEQESKLAGKYKNAEELEAAYIELQKKLGESTSEEDTEQSDPEETEDEGPTNQRRVKKLYAATQADVTAGRASAVGEMIPKLKSQAEFIESAGPLLTGESNIKEALERGGYYKDADFNEAGKTSSKVSKKSKESFDYKKDREKYTDDLVDDILFGDPNGSSDGAFFDLNEADFGKRAIEKINAMPGCEGVEFSDLDGDFVSFTMPGHPQEDPLVIEASFVTDDDGAAASTNLLKKWLNAYIKANENKFQKSNNWEGKRVDGNGVAIE